MNLETVEKSVKEIYIEMNESGSLWGSDPDKFRKEFEKKNSSLVEKYSSVFSLVFSSKFNKEGLDRLVYMLQMAKRVEDNELPEHDASVAVGQRLVDDIVKPQLDKNK